VSEDVPNLYFAGAGTHPGAGLPGVMSSGKIVADMIGRAEDGARPAARRASSTAGAGRGVVRDDGAALPTGGPARASGADR